MIQKSITSSRGTNTQHNVLINYELLIINILCTMRAKQYTNEMATNCYQIAEVSSIFLLKIKMVEKLDA